MNATETQQYRTRLLHMRQQLVEAVEHVRTALNDGSVARGEISIVRTHMADSDSEGEDANLVVVQNEHEILEAVDAALQRIDDGTFGSCEQCGREIAGPRLDALPYTPYCITCAERQQA